ncbi:MAG: hypothetical protein ACRCYZ_02220 [Alphaproteobacteria bacterium]
MLNHPFFSNAQEPKTLFQAVKDFLVEKKIFPFVVLEILIFLVAILSFILGAFFSKGLPAFICFMVALFFGIVCHGIVLYKLGNAGFTSLPSLRSFCVSLLADAFEEVYRRGQGEGSTTPQCPCCGRASTQEKQL